MSTLSKLFGGGNDKGNAKRAAQKEKKKENQSKAAEEKRAQEQKKEVLEKEAQAKKDAHQRENQHAADMEALRKSQVESQKVQEFAYDRAALQAERQFAELIAAFAPPPTPEPRAAPLQPDAGAAQVKAVRSTRRKDRRKKSGVAGLILSSLAGGSGSLGA